MKYKSSIGIVGGVGPYAGLLLNKLIFDESMAKCDSDYPEINLISAPGKISDRTEYILSPAGRTNPAMAIVDIIESLVSLGSEIVAIPCNTSHSPVIFDLIKFEIEKRGVTVQLINMIDEVIRDLERFKNADNKKNLKIGLLATRGTNTSGVYRNAIEKKEGIEFVSLTEEYIDLIHDTIYNTEYGLKATGESVSDRAVENITRAVEHLISKGTDCIIFGCTELSLAVPFITSSVPVIDTLRVLAVSALKKIKMP